jgi:hypothetical protein
MNKIMNQILERANAIRRDGVEDILGVTDDDLITAAATEIALLQSRHPQREDVESTFTLDDQRNLINAYFRANKASTIQEAVMIMTEAINSLQIVKE